MINRNDERAAYKFKLMKSFIGEKLADNDPDNKLEELEKITKIGDLWRFVFSFSDLTLYRELRVSEGICPTNLELSEINMKDNTNVWHYIASSPNAISIYLMLIKMEILPTSDALEVCSTIDQTNSWYFLTRTLESCAVMKKLMDLNILPTSIGLSQGRFQGNFYSTSWSQLILLRHMNEGNISLDILNRLMDNKIIPTSAMLDFVMNEHGLTCWCALTSSSSLNKYIVKLIEHNVFPVTQALEAFDAKQSVTGWNSLIKLESNVKILDKLLDMNILPSTSAMSIVFPNQTNNWYWLAQCRKLRMFRKLLNHGITPTTQDLRLRRENDIANTWQCLDMNTLVMLISAEIFPHTLLFLGGNQEASQYRKTFDLINARVSAMHRLIGVGTKHRTFSYNYPFAAIALSRDERDSYLGILYLAYLAAGKLKSPAFLKDLPWDVWRIIFVHVDPRLATKITNIELFSNTNTSIVSRWYLLAEMEKYCNSSGTFVSNLFSKQKIPSRDHVDRVKSMHQTLEQNGEAMYKMMSRQFCMFNKPKCTPYDNQTQNHHQSFRVKSTDEAFQSLVREGCLLSMATRK